MTCAYDAPCPEFQAQMAAEKTERWLGPNGHALLSWEVDFRLGGTARLCVRSPEGNVQWVHGGYLEIVEPERVVFTGDLGFAGGTVTFRRE